MDKGDMVYICTHSGILYSHKKNKILPFATIWIDLEGIMLSEIKSEEDKYKNFSFTCEILNFKKIIFFNSWIQGTDWLVARGGDRIIFFFLV